MRRREGAPAPEKWESAQKPGLLSIQSTSSTIANTLSSEETDLSPASEAFDMMDKGYSPEERELYEKGEAFDSPVVHGGPSSVGAREELDDYIIADSEHPQRMTGQPKVSDSKEAKRLAAARVIQASAKAKSEELVGNEEHHPEQRTRSDRRAKRIPNSVRGSFQTASDVERGCFTRQKEETAQLLPSDSGSMPSTTLLDHAAGAGSSSSHGTDGKSKTLRKTNSGGRAAKKAARQAARQAESMAAAAAKPLLASSRRKQRKAQYRSICLGGFCMLVVLILAMMGMKAYTS